MTPEGPGSQERRHFPRFNFMVEVTVSRREPPGQPETQLSAKNLSQGGVCIVAYEEYEVGELLNVRVTLPDAPGDIFAIGKVVWTKEWSMGSEPDGTRFDVGLEFVGIDDDHYAIINKYLFSRIERK